MIHSEILRDTCSCLRRKDVEVLLLAEKAHSNFVDRNFHKNGPLRVIGFAGLVVNVVTGHREFGVKSDDDEWKHAESLEEFSCLPRNSFVERFRLNYGVLNETTIDALKDMKEV